MRVAGLATRIVRARAPLPRRCDKAHRLVPRPQGAGLRRWAPTALGAPDTAKGQQARIQEELSLQRALSASQCDATSRRRVCAGGELEGGIRHAASRDSEIPLLNYSSRGQ